MACASTSRKSRRASSQPRRIGSGCRTTRMRSFLSSSSRDVCAVSRYRVDPMTGRRKEETTMDRSLLERLRISNDQVEQINALLLDPELEVMHDFLEVVGKYGTPEQINQKAEEARRLPRLLELVEQTKPENLAQLHWLTDQRDRRVFVNVEEYRRQVLGDRAARIQFQEDGAVTLEVSACQYFDCVIEAARRAIA